MPPPAHRDTGGDGPPIVLIGGADADAALGPAAESVHDPWRVVRWEVDDTGEAGAQALLGVLDELGIERAVLAGTGAGVPVALRAALASPDRTRALVLIGPLDDVELPAGLDDRLIEIDAPALLIQGPHAPPASRALAASLCAGLPDCRGVVDVAATTALHDFLPTLPA